MGALPTLIDRGERPLRWAFTLSSDVQTERCAAHSTCLERGEPMKRLYLVLSLVLLLTALALPAAAQAGSDHGFVPTGWTWDES
jgi:hypothetical protein